MEIYFVTVSSVPIVMSVYTRYNFLYCRSFTYVAYCDLIVGLYQATVDPKQSYSNIYMLINHENGQHFISRRDEERRGG